MLNKTSSAALSRHTVTLMSFFLSIVNFYNCEYGNVKIKDKRKKKVLILLKSQNHFHCKLYIVPLTIKVIIMKRKWFFLQASGGQHSPGVVELQRQVVPVFVIRWHHWLERTGGVASPVVAHVNHPILASAQLAAQFGFSCHRDTNTCMTRPSGVEAPQENKIAPCKWRWIIDYQVIHYCYSSTYLKTQ